MRKILIFILSLTMLLTPASATLTLIDSYNETYFNGTVSLNDVGEGSGQALTISGEHTLYQASFYLRQLGTSTYEYKAKLYNVTGTVGTNGKPTGSALAESNTLNASDLTTSHVQKNFTFPTPYTLVNGHDYCIVVEITSWTEGFLVVGVNSFNPTHSGNEAHNFGTGWVGLDTYDCIFWIYESEYTPSPVSLTHTKGNTWINHTWDSGTGGYDVDLYNFTINGSWNNGSANKYYNHTGLSIDDWSNITVWAYNLSNNELSSSSVSENVQAGVAPHITVYYPANANGSEVGDSQIFNVTTDALTNCTWYINGTQEQYNTSAIEHTYINSSLDGGYWNFTAIVNNANGTNSHTWLFEVGSDSVDQIITYENRNNLSYNIIWNVIRIGSNVTHWNVSLSNTDAGNTYYFRYWNDTYIGINQTATTNNETLWFNSSTLLPEETYYISETVNETIITIPANSWGMFNNWTSATTFAGIAANESNNVCYTYYNVTSGLWESYYVGYSWNDDYQLSKDASVMGYFNAQTNIISNIITPSSTELYTGWNMLGVQSSSNQTISGIIADIGANCSDSWYFNSSTGGYSNTTTHSIQPNQGFLAYITQNMTWTRSAM